MTYWDRWEAKMLGRHRRRRDRRVAWVAAIALALIAVGIYYAMGTLWPSCEEFAAPSWCW